MKVETLDTQCVFYLLQKNKIFGQKEKVTASSLRNDRWTTDIFKKCISEKNVVSFKIANCYKYLVFNKYSFHHQIKDVIIQISPWRNLKKSNAPTLSNHSRSPKSDISQSRKPPPTAPGQGYVGHCPLLEPLPLSDPGSKMLLPFFLPVATACQSNTFYDTNWFQGLLRIYEQQGFCL